MKNDNQPSDSEGLKGRFLDLKHYLHLVTILAATMFGVFYIVANINITDIKQDLREWKKSLEKDIDERLGKLPLPPKIEIFTPEGIPIEGKTITAKASYIGNERFKIVFRYFMRNVSKVETGDIFQKFYADDPLILGQSSSDEPEYKYETIILPKAMGPSSILPGKMSSDLSTYFTIKSIDYPAATKHDVLMKLYYGDGIESSFKFNLLVEEQKDWRNIKNINIVPNLPFKILYFDTKGMLLSGQVLEGEIIKDYDFVYNVDRFGNKNSEKAPFALKLEFILKNIGRSDSSNIIMKLFTNKPFISRDKSTDLKSGFEYESIYVSHINLSSGMSQRNWLVVPFFTNEPVKPDKYTMKMRVWTKDSPPEDYNFIVKIK